MVRDRGLKSSVEVEVEIGFRDWGLGRGQLSGQKLGSILGFKKRVGVIIWDGGWVGVGFLDESTGLVSGQ